MDEEKYLEMMKLVDAERKQQQKEIEAKFLALQNAAMMNQKKSFMANIDPRQELHNAFRSLEESIDAIYEWGKNAKDPLGNFLPDVIALDIRENYRRLKWLITGMYSSTGFPGNGSSGQWKW